MKALIFIILLILAGLAAYYVPMYLKGGASAHCPAGSRYVRVISGGGWADTDPSDPWGSCVSQAMIDGANNQ